LWEEAKPMFRVNVYVCVCVLCRSEFCRCIVSTIRRKRKRKRHERKEESSSDDHISVADDTVHHCLLKLDIFRSRHVLGKRNTNTIKKER